MQNWTPEDLQAEIEKGGKVFLKVWKKGCGPCKLSTPAVERIEAANEHGLVFGQICSDDHPEIHEISASDVMPAFYVWDDHALKGYFAGFKGLENLKKFIADALKS